MRVWSRPSWSGTYSLRVCHGACEQVIDPRLLAQGTPLGLGPTAAVQSALGQPGDTRLFRLDGAPGRTYIVESFDAQRGAEGSTALTVYDAEGRSLGSGITGNSNVDQTLVVTPDKGPLYVRVSGRGGWAGSFRLRVLARFDQPGAAWGEDLEPNDWCELATPLFVGAAPETHALALSSSAFIAHYPDGDSYRLNVQAGQSYEVLVDGLPPDSTQGAVTVIFHEMSTGEFVGWGASSGAGGRPASLVHRANQSGELCVRVTSAIWPAHWSGPYTIRVCEGVCSQRLFLPALRG